MNKHIEEAIEEFNRMTPDDIPPENPNPFGSGSVTSWLELNDSSHLYSKNVYGEPMLDLDKDKIRDWLRKALTSIYQRGREDEREESTKCPIPGCRRNHYKD